jgi:hypothetical protein
MLALGDGVVDRGSYARWRTSTSTYSSTRSSRAADSAAEERDRHRRNDAEISCIATSTS